MSATRDEAFRRGLVDEAIEQYIGWREACAAVSAAYARWSHASAWERSLLFAAYNAALDREASAATRYRGVLARAGAV